MRNVFPIDRVFGDVIRVFPQAGSPLARRRQAIRRTPRQPNLRAENSGLPTGKPNGRGESPTRAPCSDLDVSGPRRYRSPETQVLGLALFPRPVLRHGLSCSLEARP